MRTQPVAVNKEQVTQAICWLVVVLSPPGGCAGPHDLWHGCRGGHDGWAGGRVHPGRLQETRSLPGSHSPVPPGPPLGREEGVCVESTEGGGGGGVERIRTPFSVGPRVPGGAVPSCRSPPLGGLCPGSLGAALEGPWPRCSPRGEEGWSGVVRTCAPLRVGAPPSLSLLIGVGTGTLGELLVTRAQRPGQPPPPRVDGRLPARPGSGGVGTRPRGPQPPRGRGPEAAVTAGRVRCHSGSGRRAGAVS